MGDFAEKQEGREHRPAGADPGERVSQMRVFCCSRAQVRCLTALTEEGQLNCSELANLNAGTHFGSLSLLPHHLG